MTMSKGCVLAIAVLAAGLVSVGCGGDEDAPAEGTTSTTARKAPKADRPSSARGDRIEEAAASVPRVPRAAPINELPENFPDDVPVFPGSAPTASLVSRGKDMVVSFNTSAKTKEVFSFYQESLGKQGWSVESRTEEPLHSALVTKKDQRTATLLVMAGPAGTHITVTIAEE